MVEDWREDHWLSPAFVCVLRDAALVPHRLGIGRGWLAAFSAGSAFAARSIAAGSLKGLQAAVLREMLVAKFPHCSLAGWMLSRISLWVPWAAPLLPIAACKEALARAAALRDGHGLAAFRT